MSYKKLHKVTNSYKQLRTSYEKVTESYKHLQKVTNELSGNYKESHYPKYWKMASLQGPQDHRREKINFGEVIVSEPLKSHFIEKMHPLHSQASPQKNHKNTKYGPVCGNLARLRKSRHSPSPTSPAAE